MSGEWNSSAPTSGIRTGSFGNASLRLGRRAQSPLPEGGDRQAKLETVLGSFDPKAMKQVWPTFLGDGEYLRDCLRLGDEALDAAVLRMIDSRGPSGDHVLRAAFG